MHTLILIFGYETILLKYYIYSPDFKLFTLLDVICIRYNFLFLLNIKLFTENNDYYFL